MKKLIIASVLLVLAAPFITAAELSAAAQNFKATSCGAVRRGEVLKSFGVPAEAVRDDWNLAELDSRVADFIDALESFSGGTAGASELLDRELDVIECLLRQPGVAASPLEVRLRRGYLQGLRIQLKFLRLEYEAGTVGAKPIRRKEREIAGRCRAWGLAEREVVAPSFVGEWEFVAVKDGKADKSWPRVITTVSADGSFVTRAPKRTGFHVVRGKWRQLGNLVWLTDADGEHCVRFNGAERLKIVTRRPAGRSQRRRFDGAGRFKIVTDGTEREFLRGYEFFLRRVAAAPDATQLE